ncbi:MAG: acyl carrier protein [Pseudomonadota bacterium]
MSVETVEQVIIGLTQDLIEDWGLEDAAMSAATTLKGDLGFASADTMQLFTMIQEHYSGITFKFQELVMKDGKFIDDLTLGQVIVFILKKLSSASTCKAEVKQA